MDCDSDHSAASRIFELLISLHTPTSSHKSDGKGDAEVSISATFQQNVDLVITMLSQERYRQMERMILENKLHADDSDDISWRFPSVALKLLLALCRVIGKTSHPTTQDAVSTSTQPSPPRHTEVPPMFSINQQKTIKAVLQFVVGLGILPYLKANVGIPLSARSALAGVWASDAVTTNEEMEQSLRLVTCLRCIMILIHEPSLGSLILTSHLGDVLAGFIQMSYCPDVRKLCTSTQRMPSVKAPEEKLPGHVDGEVLTEEGNVQAEEHMRTHQDVLTEEDILYCRTELRRLVEKSYQADLMRELLLLQGAPAAAPRRDARLAMASAPPVWLRRACGRILTVRLMEAGGMRSLLTAMMPAGQGGQGSSSEAEWRKHEAMGRIMASCSKSQPVTEYYKALSTQIADLLHTRDALVGGNFLPVAVATVKAMLELHPVETQSCVLDDLTAPLLACTSQHENQPTGPIVVPSPLISRCVTDVHLLLTMGRPSQRLCDALTPLLHTLLCICCHLQLTASPLRPMCQSIIEILLDNMERQEVTQVLHILAFPHLERTLDCCQLRLMDPNLEFVQSQDSDFQVMIRGVDERSEITCDTAYSQVLSQVIVKLKQEGIAADFFLSLLKDLTKVISSPLDVVPSGGHLESDTLLEVEERLERETMQHSYNLRVLTLVGDLAEVLGEDCLSSQTHIVDFVEATLERCIFVMKNCDDVSFGAFETETITLAMGLLSAYLGALSLGLLPKTMEESEEQSAASMEEMQRLIPLLSELKEHHPDPVLQETAENLAIAVATHGRVQLATTTTTTTTTTTDEKQIEGNGKKSQQTSEHAAKSNIAKPKKKKVPTASLR